MYPKRSPILHIWRMFDEMYMNASFKWMSHTPTPSQAGWRKKKIKSATGADTDIKASRELLPTRGPPYSHTQLQRTAGHLRRDTRQESSGWLYSFSEGASQAAPVLPCEVTVVESQASLPFSLFVLQIPPTLSILYRPFLIQTEIY